MSIEIHSYASPLTLGHRDLVGFLDGPVWVEEKVDGSQFSFKVCASTGVLHCRSKGQVIDPDNVDKMFSLAVAGARDLRDKVPPGLVFRCEYLGKPKHNTIRYERTPRYNLVLFDIEEPGGDLARPQVMRQIAEAAGMETVPLLYEGIATPDMLQSIVDRTKSLLGDVPIEGVVIKRHDLFDRSNKPLIAKYVSATFKEAHKVAWKSSNPGPLDAVAQIGDQFRVPARWQKAVQSLMESGKCESSPRDIPALMAIAKADLLKEHGDEIRESLLEWFVPRIQAQSVKGLAEWYKSTLASIDGE